MLLSYALLPAGHPVGLLTAPAGVSTHGLLSHAVAQLYARAQDVPACDLILLVKSTCMVKPDIFLKLGPCMLDNHVGACCTSEVSS